MSAWRVALAELYRLGGAADGSQIGDPAGRDGLRRHGLAEPVKPRGKSLWKITPRGIAVAEGRIAMIRNGPHPTKWVVTWLESLPRGVRIAP